MDDFIMRKREDEVFVMMIEHRESQVILMVFAMDRVPAEINQGVVHPTHIPLEGEAQTAEIRRTRYLRPCRGFLGNRHDAGKFGVSDMVEFAQEIDGFEIFATTV